MLKDKISHEQSQLVSQISHDLRNILTLIDSSLQLMETNHPEVRSYKFWPETKKDIKYMGSYLIALSDYNKSGMLSLTTFDLRRMLIELQQELSFTILEKNLSITLDTNQEVQYIVGDPMKLNHAIKNIIRNSWEACETTGIYGKIKIILEKTDSKIVLKISDNGQGIPPDFIREVFTPFSTLKKEHIGLGLSISQRIIQAHNGTIKIESQVTEGTTVIINLPFLQK